MLKVKDSVDLKELEKYGFKQEHWGYIHYPNTNSPSTRYFSNMKVKNDRRIELCLENMSTWCNSLEELEDDMNNIKKSYEAFKIKCDDLIKDGLVEKVEG